MLRSSDVGPAGSVDPLTAFLFFICYFIYFFNIQTAFDRLLSSSSRLGERSGREAGFIPLTWSCWAPPAPSRPPPLCQVIRFVPRKIIFFSHFNSQLARSLTALQTPQMNWNVRSVFLHVHHRAATNDYFCCRIINRFFFFFFFRWVTIVFLDFCFWTNASK